MGRAEGIARDSGVDFLVGVEDWKENAAQKWIATNSATLLAPSGRRLFTYDKIHLVPWGEYVPLRHLLSFAGKLTADIGDFTPGNVYQVGWASCLEEGLPSSSATKRSFLMRSAVSPRTAPNC